MLSPEGGGGRAGAPEAADAPDALTPPPGNPRFPLFDSLRAIAALSIVLVHTTIFTITNDNGAFGRVLIHLDIGVTIFFLLSGFLLYRPFVSARVLGSPAIRLRDYGRRRFLRIMPAYWLALTVLALFPGIYGVFTGNWWVYYGLLQNFPIYTYSQDCVDHPFSCGIGPTWSLAVEIFFYAVLPFFALGMAWLTARLPRRRWPLTELVVLAALGFVSVLIQRAGLNEDYEKWLFFSPLGRAWWFGLGMALAVLSVWVAQRGRSPAAVRWAGEHPGLIWGTALGSYLAVCLIWLPAGPTVAAQVGLTTFDYLGGYLVFGLIAALILLPAIFGDRPGSLARRVLAHPVLAWLGLVSYGIFLWHYPVLVGLIEGGVLGWWPEMSFAVLTATTLAITLVCASLSYYLVERPLMRRK